jgi:hypothetical protein
VLPELLPGGSGSGPSPLFPALWSRFGCFDYSSHTAHACTSSVILANVATQYRGMMSPLRRTYDDADRLPPTSPPTDVVSHCPADSPRSAGPLWRGGTLGRSPLRCRHTSPGRRHCRAAVLAVRGLRARSRRELVVLGSVLLMVVGAVHLAACERVRSSGCAASWTTSRARYLRRLLGRISGRRVVCICRG